MENNPSPAPLTSISVFFPAYNDAGTIAHLVRAVNEVLPKVCQSHEIIVIDDGSRDGTGRLLDELCQEIEVLRVIHHPHNRGYGAALRSGFLAAKKDWVFYTDGDGQYDPQEITKLVAAANGKINVVNGYKTKRRDTKLRTWIGNGYRRLVNSVFGIPVRDVDCDFRLIYRNKLAGLDLVSNSGAICVELVKKLERGGCAFADVPVSHFPRTFGHSQFFRVKPIFTTIIELVRLYGNLNASLPQEKS
ncbi:MAG TPA: glycosyltransferase family 2 protein [Longilinea sp.]|nr:glycosyltransferase family 2 protein [Longilinea sp.]